MTNAQSPEILALNHPADSGPPPPLFLSLRAHFSHFNYVRTYVCISWRREWSIWDSFHSRMSQRLRLRLFPPWTRSIWGQSAFISLFFFFFFLNTKYVYTHIQKNVQTNNIGTRQISKPLNTNRRIIPECTSENTYRLKESRHRGSRHR